MLERDYADEYDSEVVLTTHRVSRKARKCDACGAEIRPGERYMRRFLVPDADHSKGMTVTEHMSGGCDWYGE